MTSLFFCVFDGSQIIFKNTICKQQRCAQRRHLLNKQQRGLEVKKKVLKELQTY